MGHGCILVGNKNICTKFLDRFPNCPKSGLRWGFKVKWIVDKVLYKSVDWIDLPQDMISWYFCCPHQNFLIGWVFSAHRRLWMINLVSSLVRNVNRRLLHILKTGLYIHLFWSTVLSFYCLLKWLQRLEEQFAQQLEDQEQVFGPSPPLPADLPDLPVHDRVHHMGSTRSSLSSVSEGWWIVSACHLWHV
jgi:hypothetical protein